MVGYREGIAPAAVAELELALEVGAPEVVGVGAGRRRSLGLASHAAHAANEPVAIEHGVHRRGGRDPHVAGEAADGPDSRILRAPQCGFSFLAVTMRTLDLARQLVGVAHGAAGAVGQCHGAILLVALEQLVAGLPGDAELPADTGHRLALEQAGDEAQALIHDGAFLPRHRHPPLIDPAEGVTHVSGTFRHPCLRTHI